MTTSFGSVVARDCQTFKNAAGLTIYHVVNMEEGGFVVTSADTTQQPVVCFSGDGSFDGDPRNPLTALLDGTLDPAAGVPLAFASAAALGGAKPSVATAVSGTGGTETAAEREWRELLDDSIVSSFLSVSSESSLTDVRVSPLVSSKWGQSGWGGYSTPRVFNYYTPNNYVCGCVATAFAQIMRKWSYPTASVSAGTYGCFVDGSSVNKTMLGGTYAWNSMPLSFSAVSSPSTVQCQAIGKLMYDVGVASTMSWKSEGSGTFAAPAAQALRDRFGFASANSIFMSSSAGTLPAAAQNAIYSSLDAGMPVAISIKNASGGGHEVVVDGYGYKSGTRYSHLNCGWNGSDDVWYNLMGESLTSHAYTTMDEVAYNIHPTVAGDTISGRVLNASGSPVSGATVTLENSFGTRRTATTNAKGIYSFRVSSGGTYQVYAASGLSQSSSRTLNITRSVNSSVTHYANYGSVTSYGSCGSQWGVDLALQQQSASRPDLSFVAGESTWPSAVYLSSTASGRTSKSSFTVNDTIYLHVGFGNTGTAAVGNAYKIKHEILQGSTVLSSRTWDYDAVDHDRLAVGAKAWWDGLAWSGFSGLSAGTYTYRCTLDSTGMIAESNESNNTATFAFTVTGGATVSLAEAVDNSSCVYTTGGAASWFGQTSTYTSGGDAAQSGVISHSQSSWFQTTVTGSGTAGFWWKVSSEANYDKLHFYVDGVSVTNISGAVGWQYVSCPVSGTGSHTIKWSYEKDGSVNSGSDCGWVDAFTWTISSQTTTFNANGGTCATTSRSYTVGGEHTWLPRPVRSGYLFTGWFTSSSGGTEVNVGSTVPSVNRTLYAQWVQSSVTLAEALTASSSSPISFATGGDAPWHAHRRFTYDGIAAAWNGVIGANQSSWVQTTVTGPGTLSFRWCVACEANYDKLRFVVDGTEVDSLSANGGSWAYVSTNLTAGAHTVRWNYTKDGSVDRSWDAGWLDDVCWTPSYVTITFDPNGGSVSPTSRSYTPGSTYGTLPTPTRSNYIFQGWYTAASGGSQVAATSVVPSTATTLYAHWTPRPMPDPGPYVNSSLTFTTSSGTPWFGQTAVSYDGNGSAQSGAISHSEESWMETTVTGSGELKFWFKASTESNYDWLHVYIDGVSVTNVSGEVDWTQFRQQITGSGTHRIRWSYTKDGSVSRGSDACWVDKIEWGVVSDLNFSTSGGTKTSDSASLTGSHQIICTGRPSWVTSVVLHTGAGSSTISGSGTMSVTLSGSTYFTVSVGSNTGAARSWTMLVRSSSGDTAYTLNVHQEAMPGQPNLCFATPDEWPCAHYLAREDESREVNDEFDEDDDIYLYASFQNDGRAAITETFVILHEILDADGHVVATLDYAESSGLVADRTLCRCWDGAYWDEMNQLIPGDYVHRVTLDFGNVIDEEDEGDNVSEYAFTVLSSTVTVQFDANGGTVSPTSRAYETGSTYGTLPTPARSGYNFLGWYTTRSSGGSQVTASTIVLPSVTVLYARWSQVAQPDLQVVSLTASANGEAVAGPLRAGTRVTLSIRVKNAGTGSAAATRAKILAASGDPMRETVLGYLAVSALSANGEAAYAYDVQPSCTTTYAVQADADSAVAESNELNNRSADCRIEVQESTPLPWQQSDIVGDDHVFPTIVEQMSVNFNDDAASAGSVVAAFLAGTDTLYGMATVDSNGKVSFFVNAQAGRRLHFKFWNVEDGEIYDAPSSSDLVVATPGDIFTGRVLNVRASSFAELELSFATAGWHLMSVNQVPVGASLSDIFNGVTAGFDYIIGDTDLWSPRFGGTLAGLVVGKGYWIHTTQPNFACTISGVGDETTQIELKRGWNTMGYPLANGGMAGDVLKTAYESGKVRYICSTESNDLFPVTLRYPMAPGGGYWVYANEDCTIAYDAEGAVAGFADAFADSAAHPWSGEAIRVDARVFPTVYENITVKVDGEPASKGDVLAIIGDDDADGVWAVGEVNGNGAATLHVMSNPGRGMHFELWRAESGLDNPTVYTGDVKLTIPDTGDPITGVTVNFVSGVPTVVTLDPNGGSGGGGTVAAWHGKAMPRLDMLPPTRIGYAFDGYSDARSGGVKYYTATLDSARDWDKDESAATLYAQWIANSYTIAFNANGGSGDMASQLFMYDVAQALASNRFAKAGYSFAGWADGASAVVTRYADGEVVSNLTAEADGIVTLYATWLGNEVSILLPDGSSINARVGDSVVLPATMPKSGYNLVGWTDGKTTYKPGARYVIPADTIGLEPVYELAMLYGDEGKIIHPDEVVPYSVAASVYDGYIVQDGVVKGTVQIKVAKGKTDRKSGAFSSKVTATVQLAGDSKKISFKNGVADEYGNVTGLIAKGYELEVSLGVNGMCGSFRREGDVVSRLIDGARNIFSAKDADSKAAAKAIESMWVGAVNVVGDNVALAVSIAKKGKAKVSGTVNGAKVSATSQLLVGEEACCVPVVITKKANLAFNLWLLADGSIEIAGLEGVVAGKAGALKPGASFRMDGAALSRALPGLYSDYLPNGLPVVQSKTKWIVAPDAKGKAAKAGKVALDKKTGEIDETKLGANPSGLKLTYKAKDGSFKGSFKAYNLEMSKIKAYTVNVTGVMVGDVGYGTATLKKPAASFSVMIK